jgi:hypothetical protein
MEANTIKNLLSKAREDSKAVEECMMKLFTVLWNDVEIKALFVKEGSFVPNIPTRELCLKYCTLYKDRFQ